MHFLLRKVSVLGINVFQQIKWLIIKNISLLIKKIIFIFHIHICIIIKNVTRENTGHLQKYPYYYLFIIVVEEKTFIVFKGFLLKKNYMWNLL